MLVCVGVVQHLPSRLVGVFNLLVVGTPLFSFGLGLVVSENFNFLVKIFYL